ncbi:MAG: hypothetical protein LUG49_08850 [Oscillospiraceae bacterium]|nr:hypothetical protein [Oscillospiraceae bacterium]
MKQDSSRALAAVIVFLVIVIVLILLFPPLAVIPIIIALLYFISYKNQNGNSSEHSSFFWFRFFPTKKVKRYLWVDDKRKKFRLPSSEHRYKIYNYSDILDFELIEDGNTVSGISLSGLVTGGLLFGKVGALLGEIKGKQSQTCSRLHVRIMFNNVHDPMALIKLIDSEVSKSSLVYQTELENAQKIISILNIIKTQNAQNSANQ